MRIVLDLQGAQSESRFRGIGRYSLSLARAIAAEASERDAEHEVWLALSSSLPNVEMIRAEFSELVPRSRIVAFNVPGPVAERCGNNAWRARSAELLREQFLTGLEPDIVHVSSLFEGWVDDATVSIGASGQRLPTAATLYDLIPLLRPETYLAQPDMRAFYLRKLQSLKRADALLAISDHSATEAVEALHLVPERITTIFAGIDPSFRPPTLRPGEAARLRTHYGLDRPFVLYAGAADPRKNIAALIDAFARLPPELRDTHCLVVVGRIEEGEQRALRAAAAASLSPGTLKLTGYVPDVDLVALYGLCELLAFPSLHEGFGFPAAEAMACGAAVIASNRTSLPEILDCRDALFDPEKPASISALITRVLTDHDFRAELRATGPERARRFTWENSARSAWDAFEAVYERRRSRPIAVSGFRPRLAVVSPLPPERSGVADYAAEHLPELAAHYDITCIVAQETVVDDWTTANFAVHDVAWFEQNARSFDRVLYHFGNSPFHAHMFRLLERIPGVVTLHDFYLSSVLRWMAANGGDLCAFDRAAYESHGLGGLVAECSVSETRIAEPLPCSGQVIALADGVIVHSHHAIELARFWYGEAVARKFRQVPFMRAPQRVASRNPARERLGIDPNDFVVCSFGWTSPTKLNRRLFDAWVTSGLGNDPSCRLLFVGGREGNEYGAHLEQDIQERGHGRVQITGFVPPSVYRDHLAAADAAVQLRTESRGETSAAIFDCLWQRLPVVVNAHGSAAELSREAVVQLEDNFSDADLAAALRFLHDNRVAARALGERGFDYVRHLFSPTLIAERCRDAIEAFADAEGPSERRIVGRIAALTSQVSPRSDDLTRIAQCVVSNRSSATAGRLFYDVTNLETNDLHTGIERVTRSLLAALAEAPPKGMRLEPVRATEAGYVHAYAYAARSFNLRWTPPDSPVRPRPGDVLLNTEWTPNVLFQQRGWIAAAQANGLAYLQMVYDLLPVQHPGMFPEGTSGLFSDWLTALIGIADGIVCISEATETALRHWLNASGVTRRRSLGLGVCELGSDLVASLPTSGLPPHADSIVELMGERPAFLMVGTIEPRKAHRQVLDAFEHLWAQNIDVSLIIVGKAGWMTEDLALRLEQHTEAGQRLLWLQGISDEMLEHVYRNATALIAASVDEGYGLPLIEAARHGVPILARDISVFREVAGPHASYFKGEDRIALADAVRQWLDERLRGAIPDSTAMPQRAWQRCAAVIAAMIAGEHWSPPWSSKP